MYPMIAKPKGRMWGRTAVAQALALCLLSTALPALASQWVQTTSLPAPYSNHTLSYANGYLYQAGGFSSGAGFSGSNVFYAKVNGDGTIGAWNNATSLPQAIFSHAGVAANGCVYVLGGEYYNGTVSSNVYYAKINADGSLGAWQMATPMPDDLQSLSASVWNGRIYVIGGYDQNFALQNTVYSAAIQADGSLSAWTTQTPFPVAAYVQAEAANGFLYVLGGAINNGSVIVNTVYYSQINTNGSLAGWNQTTSLPQAESAFGAVAANGFVFSIEQRLLRPGQR
jgi:N-acetylneuraminic acid mutarotase